MSVAAARRLPTGPPRPLRSPRPPRPHHWTYARSRPPPIPAHSAFSLPAHVERLHVTPHGTHCARKMLCTVGLSFSFAQSRTARFRLRPNKATASLTSRGALRATQQGKKEASALQKPRLEEGSSGAPGRARVAPSAPSAAFVPQPSAAPTSGVRLAAIGLQTTNSEGRAGRDSARCASEGEKSRSIHFPPVTLTFRALRQRSAPPPPAPKHLLPPPTHPRPPPPFSMRT